MRSSVAGQAYGVSMIEIMIVIAIVAVLAVFVGPDISTQLRNAQIRNAAEAMQAGLQKARAEAITKNTEVRFSLVTDLSTDCALSSTAGSWVVSLDDPNSKCDTTPSPIVDPRIIAVHYARDGNTLANVVATQSDKTTAASVVVFSPFGRPLNATQLSRIVLNSAINTAAYREYRIDVSNAGSVRMCDARVSITSDDPRRCVTP